MDPRTFPAQAAKAELHLHLEGSVQPLTLLALARKNRVELPAADAAGLAEWFRYTDFGHFVQVYIAITRCLKDAEDWRLAVLELGAELARQRVLYAEVTTTPGTALALGTPAEDYRRALAEGRREVGERLGVELNWVFDIVRNLEPGERARQADLTLALAHELRGEGVVGLGLGGLETGHPPEDLEPWFERARALGLPAVPHAGELAGPESVRAAIERLGAVRIGHGVRASEDPALVELIVERGIVLEVCPTSNLRLGVYPSLAEHPLRRLVEAGVRVTIGSDDPPLFNTTLTAELGLLAGAFGLDAARCERIRLEGARASLLPPERKAALLARMQGEAA